MSHSGRRALPALAALLLALGPACPRTSPRTLGPGPARVLIQSPSGRESAVRVELARTPAEQERGLMWRRELSADQGMLFVFKESSEHAFWMKNTLIPLDMIFIGEDLRVLGVVANALPLTTEARTIGVPSRYVLEVNGGYCADHGVAAGDLVRFEGL